jgi:YjbE family integral membrane protein
MGADGSMILDQPAFWIAVLQIIWIDLLLSGDNAVVIALACRRLPPKQRIWGVVLGTVVAIALRVIFAGVVTTLMQVPYLKIVGGALLLWIAVKLLTPEEENGKSNQIEAVDKLWRAIRIVAIADLVMSLDNVIAIAAVAERFEAPHSYALLMFGLAVSIPLIMAGAALVMALLDRFPIVVWAGAALLGWIAGEIIAKDPLFTANLDPASVHTAAIIGATLGALFVVAVGLLRRRWLRRSAADQV